MMLIRESLLYAVVNNFSANIAMYLFIYGNLQVEVKILYVKPIRTFNFILPFCSREKFLPKGSVDVKLNVYF